MEENLLKIIYWKSFIIDIIHISMCVISESKAPSYEHKKQNFLLHQEKP